MFENPKFKKQISIIYLLSYMGGFLGYLLKILFARNLSVKEFGLIYAILGLFSFISIFNDFGMSETLNYFGVKFYEKKKWLQLKISFYYSLLMQGVTAILISIIIFFLSDFLLLNFFKFEKTNILLYFLIYFIFFNLSRPIQIIFNTSKKYHYSNLFSFFQLFFTLIFSSIVIFFKLNYIFISFAYGLPFLILFFVYLYIIFSKDFCNFKKVKFKFDFKLYKKLFSYALLVVIGSGALLLHGAIDRFFITYFLDVSKVGFYEIALSLASIIQIILAPFISILFPLTTKLLVNKKILVLNSNLSKIYKFFLIIGIPFTILFTLFPREIIFFLFGEKYLESSNVLIILSIAIFISIFQNINFYVLNGMGKIKEKNKLLYSGGFLNIILNFIFVKIFGLIGIGMSTLFVVFFMFLFGYFLNRKNGIKISIKFFEFLKILFCNFIFFILVYF